MWFNLMFVCCAALLSRFSHLWLFVTLWTVARQAPLSMGFSRQEYWSGLPFPSPGDLPDSGFKPLSLQHCRWILYQLCYLGIPNQSAEATHQLSASLLSTTTCPAPRLPSAPWRESNPALPSQPTPSITSLFLLPLVYKNLFVQLFHGNFLSARLGAAQFINHWIKAY